MVVFVYIVLLFSAALVGFWFALFSLVWFLFVGVVSWLGNRVEMINTKAWAKKKKKTLPWALPSRRMRLIYRLPNLSFHSFDRLSQYLINRLEINGRTSRKSSNEFQWPRPFRSMNHFFGSPFWPTFDRNSHQESSGLYKIEMVSTSLKSHTRTRYLDNNQPPSQPLTKDLKPTNSPTKWPL